jgi:hypothetical protein
VGPPGPARRGRPDASRATNREPVTTGSLNDIHEEALMGSTLKFDSERRELVRERRTARIERKQQRREARERKHSEPAAPPPAPQPSALQRAAQQRLDEAVEGVVAQALERHDRRAPAPEEPLGADQLAESAGAPARFTAESAGAPVAIVWPDRASRGSRRESDIAEFRERRQRRATEARSEARERIARSGEPAAVADAMAALAHPSARPWEAERQQLERAIETGRSSEIGAAARAALWAITRDAARSSRRARRDPDLALAVCVAYAILARVPRTALRSTQRARPQHRRAPQRAFWR